MPNDFPPASSSPSNRHRILAEMLDSLTAAVAVVDPEGNLIAANKSWASMMVPKGDHDQKAGAAQGVFRHCLPPAMATHQMAKITAGIQAVMDGTAPAFYAELKTSTENDSNWYKLDIHPFAFQHPAVIMTYHDVNEKRTVQQALKESRGHLYQAQKMEALGTLVAGVAHEINNPISLIMFNLPLVRRVWQDILPVINQLAPPAVHRKYGGFSIAYLQSNFSQLINDMDMAANRVSKIVRDLKNFSRQSHVSEKEPLQINDAVNNAVRLARTTIRKTGVDLTLDLKDNLPLIQGNLPSIEQIVLNVLINAAQALGGAQGQISIETGMRAIDANVFVAVSDNGRGVSPAIADKLFDPFVTDKQNSGGTGLGLAVSYSLAQAHAGTITFESVEGEGTTFTIWLPTAQVQDFVSVLVVDDDAMVRKLIVKLLSKTGQYQVEEAASGIDGLLRIGTTTPDLLILDLKMPGMNGLDVCRAVRQNDQLTKMKVLITTGHPHHPDLQEIRDMGYTDCYTKPIRVKSFGEVVAKMTTSQAGIK
jgi:signal transduction histidine kinase/ActR/RegA family two-component response regulator